jgi:hypothetical protein
MFLTGCTVEQVDNKNVDEMVDTILSEKLKLYNQTSNGYKYYIPRGMVVVDSTSYNERLYGNGNTYYLYVDIVSYYFKKNFTYEENKKAYFSKKLDYNKKKGYLEITKLKNMYFVEMMFNYSKIEVFVPKDEISESVINASYILSTLVYNDTIIKRLFDEKSISYSEIPFELFNPKRKEGQFLDYVKEFDQYEDTIDDEDLVAPSDTENENSDTMNELLQ